MLAAIKTSAAIKIAAAIGASAAIGATAIAGPEILPFIDGDEAVQGEIGVNVDSDLFNTQLEGTTDGSEGLDTDASVDGEVGLG